jgi:CPA2 family monovalent cation:H+ antiporter-2
MHDIRFIQDLAVMMAIAGLVTVVFHRLKQPVVLGYILAGVIIGPHTPPFGLVNDESTIHIFSEMGVIFLMFSLGLEFSVRNLIKVGLPALITAVLEILVMIWVGYEIGQFFHWRELDSVFLGAMLAISSTTIIVKTLGDLRLRHERFAHLVFGILVVEDILAIAILALLSSIGTANAISTGAVMLTLGKLSLFLTISLVVGILTVPRLLAYVAKFRSQETLLIAVLGLCFGFCLLVVYLDYSIVLGAFVIGAVIAESQQLAEIEHLVQPLRNMFSAVFFITIGLMLDPQILMHYAIPTIVITVAVVLGKVATCSAGMYLTGQGAKTGMRVGMGLAQIGEFSFIIAALGLSLKVTSDFLYPIAVSVSVVTTLLTPYLIKASNPLVDKVRKCFPARIVEVMGLYTSWLQQTQFNGEKSEIKRAVQYSLVNVALNLALITGIFVTISYIPDYFPQLLGARGEDSLTKTLLWGSALAISLPFLIAIYRKLKALSMLFAAASVRRNVAGAMTNPVRRIIAEVIPVFSMIIIVLLIFMLSSSILPSIGLLFALIIAAVLLALFLYSWFIKLHSRIQISFMDTFSQRDENSK